MFNNIPLSHSINFIIKHIYLIPIHVPQSLDNVINSALSPHTLLSKGNHATFN